MGYKPSQLRAAYAIPKTGGSTQTVAVIAVGDDPNAAADLAVYRAQYGLPACTEASGCFRKRDQHGGTSFPTPEKGSAEETSLDLDMVSAACSECHILLVEAEKLGSSLETLKAMGEAVNQAVTLGATEISISYGVADAPGASAYLSYFEHPGVPTTVDSGDFGYENFLNPEWQEAPNFPATSPDVIAVGGTTLSEKAKTARGWTDSVWATAKYATGSGCSNEGELKKPKWQEDTGCNYRMTTDVSAVAENLSVYDSYETGTTPWLVLGGTSASAPFVAGVYAYASKQVREHPGEALYRDLSESIGSVLDVTPQEGLNNSNYGGKSCSSPYLCEAIAGKDGNSMEGYDGPTGVGVLRGPPTLPEWAIQETVNLSSYEFSELVSVDCSDQAATACTAVGRYYAEEGGSLVERTLAERWNGSTWSLQSTPFNTGTGPRSRLNAVSCPETSSCVAVGSGTEEAGEHPVPLMERWNGSTWGKDVLPHSASAEYRSGGVACTTASACMVVGETYEKVGGEFQNRPFALRLNAGSWKTVSMPLPTSAVNGGLSGVHCASASMCVAVGWYETATSTRGLIERWNGSAWAVDGSAPAPGAESWLNSVSCPSEFSCMAVGWSAAAKFGKTSPVAEHWDGTTWTVGSPPEPEGAFGSEELVAVSCFSGLACSATGYGISTGPFIDAWNGTSWAMQKTPSLSLSENPSLAGIKCGRANRCVAMGYRNAASPVFSEIYKEK